MEYHYSEIVIL